eukprot:scaffold330884_cov42-Prasinocladus_malaysianus.AAC.4
MSCSAGSGCLGALLGGGSAPWDRMDGRERDDRLCDALSGRPPVGAAGRGADGLGEAHPRPRRANRTRLATDLLPSPTLEAHKYIPVLVCE